MTPWTPCLRRKIAPDMVFTFGFFPSVSYPLMFGMLGMLGTSSFVPQNNSNNFFPNPPKSINFCTNCGARLSVPFQKFCTECGNRII